MTPEQSSLLISLISLALVFASPVISFFTYQRQKAKDREDANNQLESRFDSVEGTMKELTSSIKLLNQQILQMNKELEKSESHEGRLDTKINEHDVKLADHEARIIHLEEDNIKK